MNQTPADENTKLDNATDELGSSLGEIRTQMKEISDSMTELADSFGSYETTTKHLEDVTTDQVDQIRSETKSDGSRYAAGGD